MSSKKITEKGVLLQDVNLKDFTSWHIGGNAEYFYWPQNLNDLQKILKTKPPVPITFLGLGSNTLISDLGVNGTVIITQGTLKEMQVTDTNIVRAEAGLSCAQVARFAAKNNLVQGEFLAGIPGTIGGALFMNAGAFGGETWEHIIAVETINSNGDIKKRSKDEFKYTYRETHGLAKDEWFVAGYFQLIHGNGKESLEKIKALLERRAETQPTGEPSCGSVFRNPHNNYAARLIENCGLKGYRIGDAEVSPKHANFIINLGNATAQNVLDLVAHIQRVVQEKHDIELHPEMKFIGREQ